MNANAPNLDAARADFCRFLAACYYEPEPEFAEEKVFAGMAAAAAQFDPELADAAQRLGAAFSRAAIDDLKTEYLRLFLGPVGAPARPYGSLWLGPEKLLMQDSTMGVLALYREGGFELSDDFRELPDHIAAELEFLYALLFHESRKQPAGTDAEPADPVALRKRLLGDHLGRWVTPFATAMRGATQSPFYRELAGLTERFIAIEARRAERN